MDANVFLIKTKEDDKLNQYWYSKETIDFIITEASTQGKRIAFLSTPSVYFSLKDPAVKAASRVFDVLIFRLTLSNQIDKRFASDPGFVYYDFTKPTDVPKECKEYFDFIVIDPPFITHEVLSKVAFYGNETVNRQYVETVNVIKAKECKILFSSIRENAEFFQEKLGLESKQFMPSIPNLVYQYTFFANYDSEGLIKANPKIYLG